MNTILFLICTTFLGNNGSDSLIVVNYNYTIFKIENSAKMKVAIPEEYKSAFNSDSIEFSDVFLPLKTKMRMEISTNGNYRITHYSIMPGVSVNSSTTYFSNGQYYSSSDTTKRKAFKITYKVTQESKEIIGFTCVKILAVNLDTKEEYEIWGTKELPQTITGKFRIAPLGYAILEINDLNGKWKLTANKIDKIPSDKSLSD